MGQNKEACQLKGQLQNSLGKDKDLIISKFDKSFEVAIPVDEQGNFSGSFKLPESGVYSIKQGAIYSNIF